MVYSRLMKLILQRCVLVLETRKGVSQTLAILVAAAVLLMTAATMIVVIQGGFGDLGDWLNPVFDDPEAQTGLDD